MCAEREKEREGAIKAQCLPLPCQQGLVNAPKTQ